MVSLDVSPDAAGGDYPILYTAADETARAAQRSYTRLVQVDLLLLIASAIVGVIGGLGDPSLRVAVYSAAAALLGATILVTSAARILSPERDWVSGRAAAESVKAASWLYMMRAHPFDGDDAAAHARFIDALRAVLETQRDLRLTLHQVPDDGHQISAGMKRVRALDFDARKQYYLHHRINDQIRWYLGRAGHMRRASTLWFWVDVIARGAGLAFAILIIVPPHRGSGIAGLFIAVAAAATAWSQLGRYDELIGSYALTAQHLMIYKSAMGDMTEQEFGQAVVDAEETISGEHTGWLAKRR